MDKPQILTFLPESQISWNSVQEIHELSRSCFQNQRKKSFFFSKDLYHFYKKPVWRWRPRDIQRWSALFQNNFRSVSALLITWKSFQNYESALNSADLVWNSADLELISADWEKIKADQRSGLIFFMFRESALRNRQNFKQRCSELIISGTSTRGCICCSFFKGRKKERFFWQILLDLARINEKKKMQISSQDEQDSKCWLSFHYLQTAVDVDDPISAKVLRAFWMFSRGPGFHEGGDDDSGRELCSHNRHLFFLQHDFQRHSRLLCAGSVRRWSQTSSEGPEETELYCGGWRQEDYQPQPQSSCFPKKPWIVKHTMQEKAKRMVPGSKFCLKFFYDDVGSAVKKSQKCW